MTGSRRGRRPSRRVRHWPARLPRPPPWTRRRRSAATSVPTSPTPPPTRSRRPSSARRCCSSTTRRRQRRSTTRPMAGSSAARAARTWPTRASASPTSRSRTARASGGSTTSTRPTSAPTATRSGSTGWAWPSSTIGWSWSRWPRSAGRWSPRASTPAWTSSSRPRSPRPAARSPALTVRGPVVRHRSTSSSKSDCPQTARSPRSPVPARTSKGSSCRRATAGLTPGRPTRRSAVWRSRSPDRSSDCGGSWSPSSPQMRQWRSSTTCEPPSRSARRWRATTRRATSPSWLTTSSRATTMPRSPTPTPRDSAVWSTSSSGSATRSWAPHSTASGRPTPQPPGPRSSTARTPSSRR